MRRTESQRWRRKAIAMTALSFVTVSPVGLLFNATPAAAEGDTSSTVSESTGPENTGPENTGPENTVSENTGPENTGPENTAPASTAPASTAPASTAPASTAASTTVAIKRAGHPSLSATTHCVNGGGTINLILANSGGDLPITFRITHPVSGVVATQVVAPATNQQMTVLGTAAGTVKLTIAADGHDMSRAFEVSCPTQAPPTVTPQVLSADQVPASGISGGTGASLPATGGGADPRTALAALALCGAGVGAVAASKKRTRSPS